MKHPSQKFRGLVSPYALSVARAILAYALIPNLFFWLASFVSPVARVFNLDYMAVAVVAVFLKPNRSRILLAGVFALQSLSVGLIFYFSSEREAYFSIRYLMHLPWLRIAATTLLLALVSFAMALITQAAAGSGWRRRRLPAAAATGSVLAALLLVLLLCSDAMNRAVWHSDDRLSRVISSVSLHLVKAKLFPYYAERAAFSWGPVDSATADYIVGRRPTIPAHGTPRNLVLVLLESYGLAVDPALNAQLSAPYLRPAVTQRYDVQMRTVPFLGATISGEFRELCGLQLPISAIRTVPNFADQCLPRRLGRLGYRSTALHGYLRGMFDRDIWWKQIGFQQVRFYDDLAPQKGEHPCMGTFPAICDADVAQAIRQILVDAPPGQPQFIHWVTINSHLPISSSTSTPERFHCGQPSALIKDADQCRWVGLITIVNEAVAKLAVDPALPPTDFIIVGDHAPPYMSEEHRKLFSYSDVPAIYLTSKQ